MRWPGAFLAGLLVMGQAPAAPPAPPEPKPAEHALIYSGQAASILGRPVRGPDDSAIGRIADVLVDSGGTPRAAVIDTGGFLGMGSRRIAVAWSGLRFQSAPDREGRIILDMTLDQIKDTPEYKHNPGPAAPPVTIAVSPKP